MSLHHEKPTPSGLRAGFDQRIENRGCCDGIGCKLSLVQELCDRGLCLGALHAVDRVGVVAGDHQQPLDPGKPCLHVVVVGLFREVDHRALRRV